MADVNNSNFQRKHVNPVIDAVPEQIPTSALEEYDEMQAQELAKNVSEIVSDERIKNENQYDLKKLERMAKGFSEEQQRILAKGFNHYVLLEALLFQFKYFDALEADMNAAFANLVKTREGIVEHEQTT